MSFYIDESMNIHASRGDHIAFYFTMKNKDTGLSVPFEPGSSVLLNVFEKKNCEKIMLSKEFVPNASAHSLKIELSSYDMKFGKVISKPKDYWYEIQVGPIGKAKTLLGYFEDGPKVFRLYPEGKELIDGELPDEDTRSEVKEIIIEVVGDLFDANIQDAVDDYFRRNPVKDGITPHIGENGNWWFETLDTGVPASCDCDGNGGGGSGADGEDGADGATGATGGYGVTPRLQINPSTNIWEVSYNNGATWIALGVKATGDKGDKGETGASGKDGKDGRNGVDGIDGKTPVKGVDYFTPEDTEEMAEAFFDSGPKLKSVAVKETATSTTITYTMEDDSVRSDEITFDNSGYPTSIKANGKDIPVTWGTGT